MDSVLVYLEPPLLGKAPGCDIVLFASGKVVEGRSEALFRDSPEVHLKAGCQDHRRLRASLRDHLFDPVVGHEIFHRPIRILADRDDVEVPDSLFSAPVASRGDGTVDTFAVGEVLKQRLDHRVRLPEEDTVPGPRLDIPPGVLGELLLGFFSETIELRDPAGFRRFENTLGVADSELPVEGSGPGGSEVFDPEELGHVFVHLFFELVELL